MRLAIVTNILAPYRIRLFEELARRCDDFLVLLLADRHSNRDWIAPRVSFATRTLPGVLLGRKGAVDPMHFNVGAWRVLRDFRPDAVMGGGFTPAHVTAKLFCQWHRAQYIPWGELTRQHPSESSAARRWLRRWIIGGSRFCIASSQATRAAFVHYGADPEQILVSSMPVGNAMFRAAANQVRHNGECGQLRAKYAAPLLVSAGRLIDSKGWPELLRAFRQLAQSHPSATLVIAGDGPQREKYRRLADSLGIGSQVYFVGHRTTRELVSLYAAADVFAFPTLNDPYGAVLAEAMACDTVAVSSVHAAATAEFIAHGETGFVTDPRDELAFAHTLAQALSLAPQERQMLLARARMRMPDDDMLSSAIDIMDFLGARIAAGSRRRVSCAEN